MSNPYENAKQQRVSVLGPTLRFKGELSADEELLIQGRVEGTIKHSSNLTIGPEGHVKADVAAECIAVEGRVDGDLSGDKSVVVRDTAKIDGNIYSPVVTLLEGAKFNGSIDMSGSKAAAEKEPAPTPKAETKPDQPAESTNRSPGKKKSQRPEKSASAA
ncbi:MAG: polymer-forming cytoskeletal protein [Pseudomonadota bacterium]